MYDCQHCNYKGRDNFNLKRHLLSHKPRKEKCATCLLVFSNASAAAQHKTSCTNRVVCVYCGKPLSNKRIMRKHMRIFHKSEVPPEADENLKRCSLCFAYFKSVYEIEHHLSENHLLEFKEESRTFDTEEEFFKWKENFERETVSKYVKRGGVAVLNEKTVIYFYCCKNGRTKNSGKRDDVKQISNKTYCPARIQVIFSKHEKVLVKGIYRHVGHDFHLKKKPLRKLVQAKVADKDLSTEVPFVEPDVSPDLLLTTKDLHSISTGYKSPDGISSCKNSRSETFRDIEKKHNDFLAEFNKIKIIQMTERVWIVKSLGVANLSNVYVEQIKTDCDLEYDLRCRPCEACIHMFVCSCEDSSIKNNMCKHIHSVCSIHTIGEPHCQR